MLEEMSGAELTEWFAYFDLTSRFTEEELAKYEWGDEPDG